MTIHHSRIWFIICRIVRIQTQVGSTSHMLERNGDVGVVVDEVCEIRGSATTSTTGGRLRALQLDEEVFIFLEETIHVTAGGSCDSERSS